MRSYWPIRASSFSDNAPVWGEYLGLGISPPSPLSMNGEGERRGGEEFDARNGGRLDSGGEEFDFS